MRLSWRFSLAGLLLGVTIVALLPAALQSYSSDATTWSVAIGGLNLCTAAFALMCIIMGQSSLRTLIHLTVFYVWGLGSLALLNTISPGYFLRWLIAIFGMLYATWVWLTPEEVWINSRSAFDERTDIGNHG